MKRDQRWEVTKQLDHEEREQLFQDHVLELANKKRMHFRKLLEETAQVRLTTPLTPPTHFSLQPSLDHVGHALEESQEVDQGRHALSRFH